MFQYLRDTSPPESKEQRVLRDIRGQEPETPWHERILILWTEDDATRWCEGHEFCEAAFKRITRLDSHADAVLATHDMGDGAAYLYRGGWVREAWYDGGRVGVVVRVAPDGMGH